MPFPHDSMIEGNNRSRYTLAWQYEKLLILHHFVN